MDKRVTEVTVMQSQSQSGQGTMGWKQRRRAGRLMLLIWCYMQVSTHTAPDKLHSIWHFEMQLDKRFLVTLAHSKVNDPLPTLTHQCMCRGRPALLVFLNSLFLGSSAFILDRTAGQKKRWCRRIITQEMTRVPAVTFWYICRLLNAVRYTGARL